MKALHIALVAFICLAAGTGHAAEPRVREAERLAAHGELDAARAQLQTIHDELQGSGAPTSAGLHYNLGTLALGVDDVAGAVLHLAAAARRAPLDDDIRHNLEVALARRADQVSHSTAHAPGARLPPGPVRLAFGLAVALLGLLIALTSTTSGTAARVARAGLLPVGVVVVIAAGLLLLRWQADASDVAVVMGDTEARSQPEAGASGFTVHAGLTGVVVAEQQGFVRLRLENGVDVWIERGAVQLVP